MNFRPCNWCGGPIPIRKESCPRCGTPAEEKHARRSQNHSSFNNKNNGHFEASRLVLISASYMATGLGIYIVMHSETAGEAHSLLIGISFAIFGICGLVSAEQPASMVE